MKTSENYPKCAGQHFGIWAIEPVWFQSAVSAVRSGVWQPRPHVQEDTFPLPAQESRPDSIMVDNGIAFISIQDQMTKGDSKFGGTSALRTQAAVRKAARSADVRGIALLIDSPGGHANGIDSLAEEVRRANEVKPVTAIVDGIGASGAYWVASQAGRVVATRTSTVGGIGAFAVLEDTSGAAEMAGAKVHVVSSGGLKGMGVPGTEITQEMIDEVKKTVDGIADIFVRSVAAGRGMTPAQARKLADGRDPIAAEAKELGLIDAVESQEAALEKLAKTAKPKRRVSAATRIAISAQRIRS